MSKKPHEKNSTSIWSAAVIVSALGYFVDIYDLVLFSTVRTVSLKSLGLSGQDLTDVGLTLINYQMGGMLVGGVLWGILGDKKGRLTVLFGSIILYSLANLANGAVETVGQYALLRFIAGIGLAGELGAGITLVSEVLPKEKRGLGTTVIASVGVCGAVLAAQLAKTVDWRNAYYIGGILGLLLLILRVKVFESGLFEKTARTSAVARGNFFQLFSSRDLFFRYMSCIGVGLPTWFVIGILVTFAPEFAREMGVTGEITGADAIMYTYMGLAIGDLANGLLSQFMKSRKKVLAIFLVLEFLSCFYYLHQGAVSATAFYAVCFLIGLSSGFWAIFVTVGAEQFGTNLRATVATTVPNFARGALVPISILYTTLKVSSGSIGSATIVLVLTIAIALLAVATLEETFHKDLDYFEG